MSRCSEPKLRRSGKCLEAGLGAQQVPPGLCGLTEPHSEQGALGLVGQQLWPDANKDVNGVVTDAVSGGP